MASTTSPNMNLIIPTVGQEPGPTYANDINTSLSLVDTHDHSSGHGVQITPAGLNISSDLSLLGNNLTVARSLRFNPQSSALSGSADLGALYELGNDLYYIDGAGNNVRITQSGSVAGSAGTITGLPSGTASASYSAGTFIFQSATNTSANIDAGSYIFRNNTAGSLGITVSPPSSLPANEQLYLPALPSAQSALTLDASGNIVASILTTITHTTINGGSSTTSIPVSMGSIVFAGSGNRPVEISLVPLTGAQAGVGYTSGPSAGTAANAVVYLERNGTVIGTQAIEGNGPTTFVPISSIRFIDFSPLSGSNTYTILLGTGSVNCTADLFSCIGVAREI